MKSHRLFLFVKYTGYVVWHILKIIYQALVFELILVGRKIHHAEKSCSVCGSVDENSNTCWASSVRCGSSVCQSRCDGIHNWVSEEETEKGAPDAVFDLQHRIFERIAHG